MDLSTLHDFDLVARHGGFGRAARASGRPKATLSRHVADLEASLGMRLIERGERSLRLTDAGALLHARTGPLLVEIAEAGTDLGGGLGRPRGRLRVSAPHVLSDQLLGGIAAGFVSAYPDVDLEIVADDRLVDPIEEDYDVVIRMNPKPDERLAGRCVLRDERWLVTAPGTALPDADEGGEPMPLPSVMRRRPAAGEVWDIEDGRSRTSYVPVSVLRLSSSSMMREAVAARAGAALLPRSLVAADVAAGRLSCHGRLVEPATEVWVLHTSRRPASPKLTAFASYLAEALHPVERAAGIAGRGKVDPARGTSLGPT